MVTIVSLVSFTNNIFCMEQKVKKRKDWKTLQDLGIKDEESVLFYPCNKVKETQVYKNGCPRRMFEYVKVVEIWKTQLDGRRVLVETVYPSGEPFDVGDFCKAVGYTVGALLVLYGLSCFFS